MGYSGPVGSADKAHLQRLQSATAAEALGRLQQASLMGVDRKVLERLREIEKCVSACAKRNDNFLAIEP
jgi:hypothetical protein